MTSGSHKPHFTCASVTKPSLPPRGSMPHYGQRDRRWILPGMVNCGMRRYALALIVVVASGVQVAIKAREVAAGHFDADAMSRGEIVARVHGLQNDFVNLVLFQPGKRLIVAVAVAQALDGLVKVVGSPIRKYIDQLDGHVGVLHV